MPGQLGKLKAVFKIGLQMGEGGRKGGEGPGPFRGLWGYWALSSVSCCGGRGFFLLVSWPISGLHQEKKVSSGVQALVLTPFAKT